MSYNGWMIPDEERERILTMFPPRYPCVRASHITLCIDPEDDFPEDAEVEVVGHVDDDAGIEALVVTVDGALRRPDGLIYHITLSRTEDRASKESNDVLATVPFEGLDEPVPIKTRAFFSKGDQYTTTALTAREAKE